MEAESKIIHTETRAMTTGLVIIGVFAVIAALVAVGSTYADGHKAGERRRDHSD